MLHIILVILKAVGILLAAVLLLLLLALLLLLFVPLRYEVAFRHTEEDTFVRGKVSWLLHLVTARIFYEKPDGKGLLVKIGGFQLIPKKEKKQKAVKKTAPKRTRAERPAAAPKPKAEDVRKKPAEPPKELEAKPVEVKKPAAERIPEKKISVSVAEPEKQQEAPVIVQPVPELEKTQEIPVVQPKPEPAPKTFSKPISRTEPEPAAEPTPALRKSIFSRLGEKLREIPEFFKKLRAVILAIGQLLQKQFDRIKALFYSLAELKAKIDHYIEIWQEEETQTLIRSVKGYLFYLLHHIRPRKGKGYLKYGLPDPAITGQLTGLLYVLRPLAFSKLALEPVFETEEIVLEGDLVIKGHVRLVHLAYVGLKLLFDKNLKHLRQRLKE